MIEYIIIILSTLAQVLLLWFFVIWQENRYSRGEISWADYSCSIPIAFFATLLSFILPMFLLAFYNNNFETFSNKPLISIPLFMLFSAILKKPMSKISPI